MSEDPDQVQVQVLSNTEYSEMYPNSLFPEVRDSDWYSPKKPDPLLTDLIHRGHRGYVTFNRLSSSLKDKNGKPLFENLYSLKASEVTARFKEVAPDLEHDSYFSINGMNRAGWKTSKFNDQFKQPIRNRDSVQYLTSCFVDIDCASIGQTVGSVIGQIIDASDQGSIPKPSILCRSGNGIWLFWLLRADQDNPAEGERKNGAIRAYANRLNTWTRIQEDLLRTFSRMNVGLDNAVKDSARITRVLGTQNTKALIRTKIKTHSDIWLSCISCDGQCNVIAYTLEELALKIGVRQDIDEGSWKTSQIAKASDPRYRDRAIKGSMRLAQIRLDRLTRLFSIRHGAGLKFKIGNRRTVALLYARVFYGAQEKKSLEAIVDHLGKFGRNMCEQGSGSNAFDAVKEVFQKPIGEYQGWERHRYSDRTIANILQITDHESELCGIPTEAQAIERRRIEDKTLSRKEKRQRRQLLIRDWSLNTPSASIACIDDIFIHLTIGHGIECSRRTVANDINLLVSSGQVPASKFGRKPIDQTVPMFPQ